MKIKQRIYYAHSIAIYETPQEARDIDLLQALGFEVVNPNSSVCDVGYQAHGMQYFVELIDSCDALAFRANPGGSINAGVSKEIDQARAQLKPVIELPTFVGRAFLSVEDTRQLLHEVGQR